MRPLLANVNCWSQDELRRLRELAEAGAPLQLIAATLNRSETAIRIRASRQGVSLRNSIRNNSASRE